MKHATLSFAFAATICAATAPSFAETHALQPYAYVQSQSYGSNVVYTAYYARKDSKFVADFEFVGTDAGVVFGADGNGSKSVKVNTTLDATTRARIRLNGLRPSQTSDGYLCIGGFMMIFR